MSWLHFPTPIQCYSIFSTFPSQATMLSHPHNVDIYTFIAHSLSAACICSKYGPEILFFYIISVKLLLPIYLFLYMNWLRAQISLIHFTQVYIYKTCNRTTLQVGRLSYTFLQWGNKTI